MKIILALVLVLLLVAFCIWWFRYNTYHFATVAQGVLYRDGVRSRRTFSNAARRSGIRTIVRLISETETQVEPFLSEAALSHELGISLIELPIPLGGWPKSGQIQQFLSIATNPAHQPVLVHCAQGVRRTGMLVAAFQESILGYDQERAKTEILRFGHSDRSIGDVKKFIDLYDPKAQTMPENLPLGKEGGAE